MKAVIPVAGAGTHMRPHTHTQPKPLIPVAGEPILSHIIKKLHSAGIKDFIFVVGYMGDKIKNYLDAHFKNIIHYECVVQEPRLGLAHAIYLCKNFLINEPEIVIYLGDIIVDADFSEIINFPHSLVTLHPVSNPCEYGVAIVDEQNKILHLTEKPKIPKSNLALVGIYKIKEVNLLFDTLEKVLNQSLKTEYHLTEALMLMIQEHVNIYGYKVNNWYDCGKKEALLQSNRLLMKSLPTFSQPTYINSVIIPPISIHPSVIIEDSIIGPYVAIGESTVIKKSIIEDAIIGSFATLDRIILKNSIVGNDTSLKGRSQSINIGDNTEINFNE
jgi:glucose-1-phosphate thymidylyltransferase